MVFTGVFLCLNLWVATKNIHFIDPCVSMSSKSLPPLWVILIDTFVNIITFLFVITSGSEINIICIKLVVYGLQGVSRDETALTKSIILLNQVM